MRTLITVAVGGGLLLLAGCGGGAITVHGTEDVSVSPLAGETVQAAFPDVTSGSQVTVVSPSGEVIGTGSLSYAKSDASAGTALEWNMLYNFTVTVPSGESRYGIQIGHGRGTVWFTPQQLAKGPALSLSG